METYFSSFSCGRRFSRYCIICHDICFCAKKKLLYFPTHKKSVTINNKTRTNDIRHLFACSPEPWQSGKETAPSGRFLYKRMMPPEISDESCLQAQRCYFGECKKSYVDFQNLRRNKNGKQESYPRS